MNRLLFCLTLLIAILIPEIIVEINAKGLSVLKNHEGFSAVPYKDTGGVLTVGYGHTGHITGPVTQEQAEQLLKADLKVAEHAVADNITIPLNENQFSALVSLVYNIGSQAFAKSHLKLYINQGNFELAANEFDKWVYDNHVKLPGLIDRRAAEKQLFLTEVA